MTSVAHTHLRDDNSAEFDRSLLAGTNINPRTLLATDYLNHFNEAAMLIDMLASMPECMQDLQDWQERSYQEHFKVSGLRYADLAVMAYDHAPLDIRAAFDKAVHGLNKTVHDAVHACRLAMDTHAPEQLQMECARIVARLTQLIEAAGGIINGQPVSRGGDEHLQDAVDALFPGQNHDPH